MGSGLSAVTEGQDLELLIHSPGEMLVAASKEKQILPIILKNHSASYSLNMLCESGPFISKRIEL